MTANHATGMPAEGGDHASTEPSDWITLLDGARRGETEPLNQLLFNLRPYVRELAQSILVREELDQIAGARFDASDVTQTTLLSVSQSIGQFFGSTEPQFRAWVSKILHHDVVDCVREHLSGEKRSIRAEVPDGPLTGEGATKPRPPGPISTVMIRESQYRIRAAVQNLDPLPRQIVELSFFEGLSYPQIAKRLDLKERKVEKLIEKAKKSLYRFLEGKE